MQFRDYYQILGLSRDATQEEIKRAYRKLARKYHPDVSKAEDAEARFKEVGEAYEVLKDPEKRAAYDRFGENWREGQDFTPPPNWDSGFEFTGGGFTDHDPHGFSDFFEQLFGRGGPRRGGRGRATRQAEDHHAKVTLTLEEAWQGASKEVVLQRPTINRAGHLEMQPHTLRLRIPKGVCEGQKIRLAGQGEPGTPAGDLYLEVCFAPHRLYRVDGADIHLELPITPWEAALGARVKVPTLGGVVELAIPEGSQSGRRLRLKGRGLPASPPGDQYVTLKVVVPPASSQAARELYRTMEKTMPYNPRSELGV